MNSKTQKYYNYNRLLIFLYFNPWPRFTSVAESDCKTSLLLVSVTHSIILFQIAKWVFEVLVALKSNGPPWHDMPVYDCLQANTVEVGILTQKL